MKCRCAMHRLYDVYLFCLLVVILLVFVAVTSQAVHASCAPPEPPAQNLHHSDAVFRGTVTRIGATTFLHDFFSWGYPVTFEVRESWKGVNSTTVTIKGQTHFSLAVPFQLGQEYLVYAYYEGNNHEGALTTNGCKGTKPVADAQADLHVLGAGPIALQPNLDANGTISRPSLVAAGLALVALGVFFVVRYKRAQG